MARNFGIPRPVHAGNRAPGRYATPVILAGLVAATIPVLWLIAN